MKQYSNWDSTQAITGDFEILPPGGYVCKIIEVKSEQKPYGELLTIDVDIAEGEYKGYYVRQFNETGKWFGKYYQTFKSDDLRFAKGFITAIENSNPKFRWNWNEKALVGMLFGGIFGEEEYVNSNGELKTIIKCQKIRSIDSIRDGKFKIPELKKFNSNINANNVSAVNAGFSKVDDNDDDNPFL